MRQRDLGGILRATMPKTMGDKELRDRWSECGQVSFHCGRGYGLTHSLQTICLGSEDDIQKFFETGELSNELTPEQGEVLTRILDYRKENGFGARTADLERAGNAGASRHKSKATRLPAPRKRLSHRPSRTKSKSLSRR